MRKRRPPPSLRRPLSTSECLEALSAKRRELISPVLQNPRDFVLLSARALAERLKVDAATAVRIVLRMGFESYREFQRFLHDLAMSQATGLDMMQTSRAKGSNLAAHVREAVDQAVTNTQHLRNTLEPNRVAACAKRIRDAERVFIFAGDLAASLAAFFGYHLRILGFTALEGRGTGDTIHLAQTAGKKDLVFAISFRRGLRETVAALQEAKSNGCYCIGLTDTYVSPIARFSDECFIASVDTPAFGNSYAAPMCLIDGIVAAASYYQRARDESILQRAAEEQRSGFRWYRE
ncbi:MAG: MurR/RpiR family transcriptional regulator [Acidobacteriaceae bacterium]|nr:MurR/RpiR family transcriptional regulator [Acidobacteriaceae bacterium]